MKTLATVGTIRRSIFRPPKKSVSIYPNSARYNSGTYIIGQPGSGKTKLILSQVLQDIRAGLAGLAVIDVHGDLFRELTWYLAKLVARQPELAQRLVIIDPTNPDWTISFNPLGAVAGLPRERVALFLTDVVITLWKVDSTQSPRMVWLLSNSFLALTDLGLTLLDLPRWLQDANWRNSLLSRLSHPEVHNYFAYEFPRSDKEARVWIAPVLNKLGGLLFDPDIRPMLAGNPKLRFRDILDRQLVLLVNLPKGIIGEGSSALLGAFIIAQIQKAGLARADSPYRPPFILYLDEFQNYATSQHIQDILSESRKFGQGLVLGHQFLDQLTPEMRSAVINTTKTLISFRVGYRDARTLVPDIFPSPDFLELEGISGWEGLALELANLPPREFWIRRRGTFLPARKRTLDMPDPVLTPGIEANLARLLEISGQRYGRPKRELQQRPAAIELAQTGSTARRKRRRKKKAMQAGVQSATLESYGHSPNSDDHLSSPNGQGSKDDEFWHG